MLHLARVNYFVTQTRCIIGNRHCQRSLHLIRVARAESGRGSKVATTKICGSVLRSISSFSNMSSIDKITKTLSSLSIKPATVLSHAKTQSPAAWKEALEAESSTPKPYELLKTLVYKPKTAKTATPVPVVVIAREETEVTSSFVGKILSLKELRLASEDLLTEFFSLDKNSRSYLPLCDIFLYSIAFSFAFGFGQSLVPQSCNRPRCLHPNFFLSVRTACKFFKLHSVPRRTRSP